MSRFDQRFETYAAPQQRREHGYDVKLRRGSLASASFIARKFYERRHEEQGQEVASAKSEFQDWLLPIASCVIGSQTVVPQAGDVVVDGDEEWRVCHMDNSTPSTEKVGEYDWRVHARLVK